MKVNQRLRRAVVAQFHNPTGIGGHVAGWIMGHRPSNLARNRWVVDLLDIQPGERVLELGCGPGVALAAIAGRIVDGVAVGVDHSPIIIRQAQRRNATAVAAGRVQLVCAAVEDLLGADPDGKLAGAEAPPFAEPFHAALAVNTVGMWDQPQQRLAALRHFIHPGGRVALVTQPRCPGATAESTRTAGAELARLLGKAGYTAITSSTLDLDPPAVCVQATATQPGIDARAHHHR
jgi:SAM-dependent methyltransferase